jgi:hypothetical protein
MAKRTTRAKKKKVTKIQQLTDYIRENPGAESRDLTDMFDAHSSQISTARKRLKLENSGKESDSSPMMAEIPNIEDGIRKDMATLRRIGFDRVRWLLRLYDSITGG